MAFEAKSCKVLGLWLFKSSISRLFREIVSTWLICKYTRGDVIFQGIIISTLIFFLMDVLQFTNFLADNDSLNFLFQSKHKFMCYSLA